MRGSSIWGGEQTNKKLEHWEAEGRPGSYKDVLITAVKEVGGPSFFSLLVIAIAFMPIFTLAGQEGRFFKPLAITVGPAMLMLLMRMDPYKFRPRWLAWIVNKVWVGKIHNEENHPISRPLMKLYHPVVSFVLRHRWAVVISAALSVAFTIPIFNRLGSEFMPP